MYFTFSAILTLLILGKWIVESKQFKSIIMKSLIASFKKYPKSWMYLGIAIACGIGWVSGSIAIALPCLIVFVLLIIHLGKVGAQDPE